MYDSTSMDLMTKKTSKHSYIYRQMKKMIKNVATRGVLTLVLMMAPFGMMWAQEVNKKFSVTTQMFLNKQKALQKQQKAVDRRHTPAKVRKKAERLIASPDTIGGMAYTVSLADGNVLFIGSYDAIEFDSLDTNIYNMTVGNALAHMGDKEMQSAFRAFFQFGESSTGTYVFVTNFGEETGVKEVIEVKEVKDDSWYTLDGCKLDKQPTQKGMYINNGRKMVVK